jgi:hypothetical protein
MKKLTQPNEPIPVVYRDEVNKGLPQINVPDVKLEEVKYVVKIPSKTKSGYNLKAIPVLKSIIRNSKLVEQEKLFEEDVNESVLTFLTPGEHQLDKNVLLAVLQLAENYFCYGTDAERTEFKQKSVYKMVQPYYRDDAEILEMGIDAVISKVKLSTKWSRFVQRQKLRLKEYLKGNFF